MMPRATALTSVLLIGGTVNDVVFVAALGPTVDQVGPICADEGPAHRQCIPFGPTRYPREPACASRLAWDIQAPP